MQSLLVLGSTGSIGTQTLDVVRASAGALAVSGLAAGRAHARLAEQVREFRPRWVALRDPAAARELAGELLPGTTLFSGEQALAQIAAHCEYDTAVHGIVGAAGLAPSVEVIRRGKKLALANKESLVMAGPLLLAQARASGATLLPIDSEHNAIFQCLPPGLEAGRAPPGVRRILLTASGGPFLDWTAERIAQATPEQACKHPKWVMGRKISVDSATLMNKGLEVIEARILFGLDLEQVEVVVHRQSLVHSLVEYVDGSMLAQLGSPDMRTPIAHALGWPERIESGVQSLDLARAGSLQFEPPDMVRFPCLALAREAARAGGTAPAVLNAANEVAVAAFLEGRLNFSGIAAVIEAVVRDCPAGPAEDLDSVLAADAEARRRAVDGVARHPGSRPGGAGVTV